MVETGRMRWNLGGWLGGQIGGSCWMLVAGLLAMPSDPGAAIGVLGFFVLANLVGWLIWRRRDSLSPHTGLQILLPVLGLSGIATVYVLDRAGIWEAIQAGSSVTARQTYGILIVVIASLMVLFWWQNRQR